jgi:hypothetical protein
MLSLVSTSTVHIEIEADVDADEICGRIRSDAGPPGSFTGWRGLISALDSLLSADVGPTAAPGALPGGADAPARRVKGETNDRSWHGPQDCRVHRPRDRARSDDRRLLLTAPAFCRGLDDARGPACVAQRAAGKGGQALGRLRR